MAEIFVCHAKEPKFLEKEPVAWPEGFAVVAAISLEDGLSDNIMLEMAFELTNHIHDPWWDNDKVTRVGPETRSTSVGDVVVLPEDRRFRVLGAAWVELS